MEKSSKIYIAGHRGMVGSSILRELQAKGYSNFILRSSVELDLRNQQEVAKFFESFCMKISVFKTERET